MNGWWESELYSELLRISPFLCMRPFVNHCFVAPVHLKFTIDTSFFFTNDTHTHTHIVTLSRLLSLYFRFRSDFIHHAFYLNFIAGYIFSMYVCLSLPFSFSSTHSISNDCVPLFSLYGHIVVHGIENAKQWAQKWNSFFFFSASAWQKLSSCPKR